MTIGRINQVAFLYDVGTVWPSTCHVNNEEVITEHEHPSNTGNAKAPGGCRLGRRKASLNVMVEDEQAKLEPTAMHKPPQEIIA
ncbi:hypothetical protein J1N35_007286 [Gossypium stocksii]|uniref:Uncharacterized protein n=1 Tax=Gossypium stocksii TaxID=47602 RepID=A0A9D4AFE8_9ROSI|nr:hypothetical protein J1N35_007286 [Gossypium stocksii]